MTLPNSYTQHVRDLPETQFPRKIDWVNASVITLTPIAAILAAIFYILHSGFQWVDLLNFFLMYALTGTAITAGYHRYYSHRAYECHPIVQFLWLAFGAGAIQNSALAWSSDHRYHHRYTDQEGDPYNINRGFFWAHMGWVYFKPTIPRSYPNVPDLKKNRLVMWQHRNYLLLGTLVGFGIPFLTGLYFGRPFGGLIWGGLVRMVFVHHVTFLINSAAHVFGKKPHSDATTARNNWWLPILTFGEGYHNYHHTYPSDYRNGSAWYHFDTSKWCIRALSIPGLTWNLRRGAPRHPAA